RQPEPDALPLAALVLPVAVEDVRERVGGDALSAVGHAELDLAGARGGGGRQRERPPRRRELGRGADQGLEDLPVARPGGGARRWARRRAGPAGTSTESASGRAATSARCAATASSTSSRTGVRAFATEHWPASMRATLRRSLIRRLMRVTACWTWVIAS